MTYDEIIDKVAVDTGLSRKIVDRTYKSYWRAIREHVTSMPLKQDVSNEELFSMQPNVNIPSIGKLFVTPERRNRINEMFKKQQENKK